MPNLLGRLQTFLFGAAIGRASSDAVTPVLEPVKQHAWFKNQNKVLDPATAAELVAKRFISETEGQFDANRAGIADNRFSALVALAQTYPELADLVKLSNRQILNPTEVKAVLARHAIPEVYVQPLIDLFANLLSPAEVAAAVQQGHLANPNILPDVSASVPAVGGQVEATAPDGGAPSTVPLTQLNIPPVDEAAGSGVNFERLQVIANLAGLPPGSAELLTMWNRNLIDEDSVDAGLREGHLKTKWSQAYKRMRWNVLGAAEYANLHIRGWIDQNEMYEGGKLTGHTKDQMDKLYLNRGRPMAPVQAFTAWARGAPHPEGLGYPTRTGTFDEEDFLRALKQSDVRTEYGPVLWHQRYAYPALFQLGRLAQAGAIHEDRVRVILKYERYEPQDIDSLADFWYRGTASANPDATREKLAVSQAIASLKKAYLVEKQDSAQVLTGLEQLGVTTASAGRILETWTVERGWTEKLLTPSQIKKAYSAGDLTIDQATQELENRGYSPGDANLLLTT